MVDFIYSFHMYHPLFSIDQQKAGDFLEDSEFQKRITG
ncbi:hypothetical protein CHCC20441_4477 [Bacillus licheniformis]|uniref:Uncharacterized protein n=1 Tax=Bacillus licheniformis TaxID=1402 RepID=A0A8B5Y7W9_BACLI|nr:hypothetical protein B4092_3015 [Bacillus licheniformis]TWN15858.1 hypothetical protein CHCC14564_0423 [Bacillus licheniformis LMG 17339]KYC76372.1 hypothetical protein B4090_3058 [Bacillus licheniformis]KYC80911.1 hypothetical protein B4091_2930 [Bacillus licheniformis]KYC96340.1 hypothetical protein B4164_2785 [Bacillus licheniformis]